MLTEFYQKFAKELDILDPKTPDQVYKTHLEEKATSANIDSAKANLANTYVNAFVNCASKKDTLMLKEDMKEPWIFKGTIFPHKNYFFSQRRRTSSRCGLDRNAGPMGSR